MNEKRRYCRTCRCHTVQTDCREPHAKVASWSCENDDGRCPHCKVRMHGVDDRGHVTADGLVICRRCIAAFYDDDGYKSVAMIATWVASQAATRIEFDGVDPVTAITKAANACSVEVAEPVMKRAIMLLDVAMRGKLIHSGGAA